MKGEYRLLSPRLASTSSYSNDNTTEACLTIKEQLDFYNHLGINHIEKLSPVPSIKLKGFLSARERKKRYDPTWNYSDDPSRPYTHSVHPYPAMMIPQVAGRLLDTYGKANAVVLDPFCGSGTVLLEAFVRGHNAYGIDINPLSLLISKVKITPLNPEILELELQKILKKVGSIKKIESPQFPNIEYWFKRTVTLKLAAIKKIIENISDQNLKNFFKVAFSFTVRASSNTRNDEFKLYRIEEEKLKDFNPPVIEIFEDRARRNISFMNELWSIGKDIKSTVLILNEDTRYKTSIPQYKVDIVVTSPPYGDSKTTVAYGQFSRLSLQWLGFDGDSIKIDDRSLGGRLDVHNLQLAYSSPHLVYALDVIAKIDKKRAREVMAFYIDLRKCFDELSRVIKKGGFLCMVVGNRTVKGVQLPTDEIVADFGEMVGFKHVETIIRKIPNKRMPLKNSPTNKPGEVSSTMLEEYIVIMEKSK